MEAKENLATGVQTMDYSEAERRLIAHYVMDMGILPWRPIAELEGAQRYGDESGFLLMAPELADADCNVHGVGMGYFQDGPWEDEAGRTLPDAGGWLACKWNMSCDEWMHVPCTPTHYLRLRGL